MGSAGASLAARFPLKQLLCCNPRPHPYPPTHPLPSQYFYLPAATLLKRWAGETAGAVFVHVDESLHGMDVIRAFHAVDYFIQVGAGEGEGGRCGWGRGLREAVCGGAWLRFKGVGDGHRLPPRPGPPSVAAPPPLNPRRRTWRA
jgi:hypothetical protein